MEAIKTMLVSPEWWFSAIFVSIFTGVVGTYARDWLSSALSALSNSFRARLQRRRLAREHRLALLVAQPLLIILKQQRATQLMMLWMLLIFVALGYPTLAGIFMQFPQGDPFKVWVIPGITPSYAAITSTLVATVAAMFVQAKTMDLLADCTAARKKIEMQIASALGAPPA